MLETLFWLLVGHAVADFGLQSDWIAQHKNPSFRTKVERSSRPELIWIEVSAAHSMMHAGAVALATGSMVLGLLEFVAHWIIDFCKCENYFGFHTDQLLHLGCKLAWLMLLASGWID